MNRIVPIAALGAALLAPGAALANTQASADCTEVALSWSHYPEQNVRIQVEIQVDAYVHTETVAFTGPAFDYRHYISPGPGAHQVLVYQTRIGEGFGKRVLVSDAPIDCPAPPPPVKPPTPTVPVDTTPLPPTPPRPPVKPRRPKPHPPKARKTCADIPPGAGRRWYAPTPTRRYSCPLPPRFRPPVPAPPVAG